MGAALSIFVLLSVSVFVIRLASVALRLTGLDDSSARFQALSAFTGTGFTTLEAEAIVNYPVRRKIISVLMIIGNLGLVSVLATVVVSLIHTDGDMDAVLEQLAWLLGGLALIWFLILNKTADRVLCAAIAKFLNVTTELGRRSFHRLLQLGDGLSVCEHPVPESLLDAEGRLPAEKLKPLGLDVIGIRRANGELVKAEPDVVVEGTSRVVFFGSDEGHESLARYARLRQVRDMDRLDGLSEVDDQ